MLSYIGRTVGPKVLKDVFILYIVFCGTGLQWDTHWLPSVSMHGNISICLLFLTDFTSFSAISLANCSFVCLLTCVSLSINSPFLGCDDFTRNPTFLAVKQKTSHCSPLYFKVPALQLCTSLFPNIEHVL